MSADAADHSSTTVYRIKFPPTEWKEGPVPRNRKKQKIQLFNLNADLSIQKHEITISVSTKLKELQKER